MLKRGKMQRVVMGILATMFVASLVLAALSFVWPAPVHADFCGCTQKNCYAWGLLWCCDYWFACCYWAGCKWTNIYCYTRCW